MKGVHINKANVARVAQLPEVHAAMFAHAQVVGDIVRSTAPTSSGHYAASVEVRPMGWAWARSRVYVHDFKAYWIEYGAGPSPVRGGNPFRARHTLRDAVLAAGLRWDDRYAGEQ